MPAHIIVMGVSGSGKTTVAQELARHLEREILEADEMHPAANISKMSAGIPLTDDDRWPWLENMRDAMRARPNTNPYVVTCSALKYKYRQVLSQAGAVFYVHLDLPREIIQERINARQGHFMPPGLLDSQLADLEPLRPEEWGVATRNTGAPAEIAAEILRSLPEAVLH